MSNPGNYIMGIITILHSSCRGLWRLEACAGLRTCHLWSPCSEEAVRENSRNQRLKQLAVFGPIQENSSEMYVF